MNEIAARQGDGHVASDAVAAAGELGGGRGLAPDVREKLLRDLFGAAAGSQPAAGTDPAAGTGGRDGAAVARTARLEPAGRGGATGDIPATLGAPAERTGDPPADRSAAAPATLPPPLPRLEPLPPPAAGIERPLERPRDRSAPSPAARRADAVGVAPADVAPARVAPAAPVAAGKAAPSDPVAVTEAQRHLGFLGFNVGTVDGRPGPRTTEAIRSYQKASGMAVTGRVDRVLLTALRGDVEVLTAAAPPAAKAAPAEASVAGRLLGGVQRLIGHDHDSREAPEALGRYCRDRPDEWVFDAGEDRLRLCAEVSGSRVAYRPLPGDR